MSVVQRKIGGKTFAVYAEVASEMDAIAARLAEAEALLRECKLDQWENVEEMAAWRDDRDAFLAADSASHREAVK